MQNNDVTRRSFLASTGTAGSLALVGADAGIAQEAAKQEGQQGHAEKGQTDAGKPAVRVRKEIATLTAAEIETYRKAIGLMKAVSVDNFASWVFQAGVHGYQFAEQYPHIFNQCQHTHWWFLPWHRMYLYYLERIMQKILLDKATSQAERDRANAFALPYWNYLPSGRARLLPEPFRLPADYSNPLWEPRRGATINEATEGSKIPDSAVDIRALCYIEFYSEGPGRSFGGRKVARPVHEAPELVGFSADTFENNPHNSVHAWVGAEVAQPTGPFPYLNGFMSDPRYAALDPVFWLHHANVDRLWEVWLSLGSGRQNPPSHTSDGRLWRQQSFLFFDENGDPQARRVNEFLDIAALGYAYGPTSDPDFAAACQGSPPQQGLVARVGQGTRRPPKLTLAAFAEPAEAAQMVGHAMDGDAQATGSFKLGPKLDPVSVKVPAENRDLVKRAIPETGRPQLFLTISNIQFDRAPGAYYEVFLNAPEGQQPRYDSPYFVGTLTFFGLRPHGQHGGGGQAGASVRFDITEVAEKLRKANRWKDDEIRVSFTRRTPVDDQSRDFTEATFGKVSISTSE